METSYINHYIQKKSTTRWRELPKFINQHPKWHLTLDINRGRNMNFKTKIQLQTLFKNVNHIHIFVKTYFVNETWPHLYLKQCLGFESWDISAVLGAEFERYTTKIINLFLVFSGNLVNFFHIFGLCNGKITKTE